MSRLKVHVSDEVKLQITEQVLSIAEDSIANAFAWEERLLESLNRLGTFHSHAVNHDATFRLGETVRKMAFEKTYLIHYKVNKSAGMVEIISFRHGARLPKRGKP
jgi:hypothetical protein